MKHGNMLNDEGFRRQANTIFRRNTGCISRKIGEAWGRKTRRLGILTFFKRAPDTPAGLSVPPAGKAGGKEKGKDLGKISALAHYTPSSRGKVKGNVKIFAGRSRPGVPGTENLIFVRIFAPASGKSVAGGAKLLYNASNSMRKDAAAMICVVIARTIPRALPSSNSF